MKDLFDMTENGRSIGAREAIWGACDSLLVGLSFYLGFLLTSLWSHSPQTPYIAQSELVMMSLGATFCYAYVFVFRRNSQLISTEFSKKSFTIPFWNISCAYLLHLSILFLVKDTGFSSIRASIGLGYLTGYLCVFSNGIFMAHILPVASRREGKKKLIIRGMETFSSSEVQNASSMEAPAALERIKGRSLKIVAESKQNKAEYSASTK